MRQTVCIFFLSFVAPNFPFCPLLAAFSRPSFCFLAINSSVFSTLEFINARSRHPSNTYKQGAYGNQQHKCEKVMINSNRHLLQKKIWELASVISNIPLICEGEVGMEMVF
ncbi:hypothetical protein AMECASPLE_016032 [Ameca splendens]|uniref:Secreted protein n=1 Tax=Ameca splendens TaxID=208324 RepID=A0ABV0YPG4_9TELE